ncbi:MAG: hypothetical protein ACI9LN_003849 [Saprospiraceae bacterium]|jgi:hypothetical protein
MNKKIAIIRALPFLMLTIFSMSNLLAQKTVITGVVIDEHSKDPVPFANVYLKSDPSKGISSDFDGVFEISFDSLPDILESSALGYEILEIKYEGKNELKIQLSASALNLAEVVVTASGEDPAYAIMRNVVKRKKYNNRDKLDAYGCEVYNKMELDLVNITDGFKNMKLNKPFQFIFDHIDSTSEDVPFLPMFITETISDFYYQKDPQKDKEFIKGVKIVGDYENESVGQLLGIAEQTLNPYDNWINLVSKKFASPAADNGKNFYRYYLVDSAFIDNKWCYQIQYFPKHKGVNGFNGDLWVHDTTFAIKQVKLQLLAEGHINYVDKLTINQSFKMVNDSIWVPKRDYILLTTTNVTEPLIPSFFKKLNQSAPGIQAKRITTYDDFHFDKEKIKAKINEEQGVAEDAFKKEENFWLENRHVELDQSAETAYFLIDTIKNLPVIDTWKRITTTLFTGYMWGDYVDIGNFYSFLSNNDIEGFRTKFGLRTSTKFSKKFLIGGYGAYGWGDKRWKYGFDAEYVLNNSRKWETIQASYLDDYFPTPNFSRTFSVDGEGIASSYFARRGNIPFKLLGVKQAAVSYFKDFGFGLSMEVTGKHFWYDPTFNFEYNTGEDPVLETYKSSEASVKIRYGFDETYVAGSYERFSLGSNFPIVSLQYTKAFKDFFDGDTEHQRLELSVTDRFRVGRWGYTKWHIVTGKIWGKTPYLSMFIPVGNEGLIRNDRGLNLLPEYSFAADTYAWVNVDHHFEGFLLQWIPLFKKGRLRTVMNFRAIIGDMTAENRLANAANLYDKTDDMDAVRIRIPNQTPYMEASIGVENILRFFRVEYVRRLNYGELESKNWGIRAGITFTL